jgi:glucose-6-phosphate 1-dehydrogenase
MAEDFGVEGRGRFYETVGAIRDVVQNHLLQVVALLAMEPPAGSDARALQDERSKLFRQIRTVDAASVVRGQYRGYREEDGVDPAPTSRPSCVAPDLVAVGGRRADPHRQEPPGHGTEAVVEFNARPLFAHAGPPHPTTLLPPRSQRRVMLHLQTKAPGDEMASGPVDLEVSFAGVRRAAGGLPATLEAR